MYPVDEEGVVIHRTLINCEKQYAVWPADKEIPLGWIDVGKKGSKDECLAYIDERWIDMHPKSLRQKMAKNTEPTAGN